MPLCRWDRRICSSTLRVTGEISSQARVLLPHDTSRPDFRSLPSIPFSIPRLRNGRCRMMGATRSPLPCPLSSHWYWLRAQKVLRWAYPQRSCPTISVRFAMQPSPISTSNPSNSSPISQRLVASMSANTTMASVVVPSR